MDSKKMKTAKMNINIGIAVICFAALLVIVSLGRISTIGLLGYFGLVVGVLHTKKAIKHKKKLEEE